VGFLPFSENEKQNTGVAFVTPICRDQIDYVSQFFEEA
jgi:hypothetical protein